EVASVSALTEAVAEHADVDLVLLDLTMPGAHGFSSLVWLRGERPELPVIIISSNDNPRVIRRAQQFGAVGFIPKSAPVESIGAAVSAVMEGDTCFPPLAPVRSEHDAMLASRLARLTPQQIRVLLCMADGLLNKQIAHGLGLAEKTVTVRGAALLKKLESNSRSQAAVLLKTVEAEWDPELPRAAP